MPRRSSCLLSAAILGLTASKAVMAASAGCGKAPALANGVHQMIINDKARQYTLQLPSNYNQNAVHKLVFGYHWLGGTMSDVADNGYYGLQALAGDSTIFVAPDGLDKGWANNGNEDIAFTDEMVAAIEQSLCVDENLLFATGFSYGGAMSRSVACSRADVFRGVAVLSGGPLSGCDGGTEPIAYLGQHGVGDNVLPIDLGRQLRDTFVENNGCQAQSPEDPAPGSGQHIKTTYSGCSADHPVVWIGFDGGHEPLPQGDAWTSQEIWAFFLQFS